MRRVLNDAGVSAAVVVTKEKVNNVVEITLHARGEQFLHAVAKATSWETAMTTVVAKVHAPDREGEREVAGAQAARRGGALGQDAARGAEGRLAQGRAGDRRRAGQRASVTERRRHATRSPAARSRERAAVN